MFSACPRLTWAVRISPHQDRACYPQPRESLVVLTQEVVSHPHTGSTLSPPASKKRSKTRSSPTQELLSWPHAGSACFPSPRLSVVPPTYLQGYLAHKKVPPPQDHYLALDVNLLQSARLERFLYERGTCVGRACCPGTPVRRACSAEAGSACVPPSKHGCQNASCGVHGWHCLSLNSRLKGVCITQP